MLFRSKFQDSKIKNKTYTLPNFQKTVEFGGKEKGKMAAGIDAELKTANSINDQIQDINGKTGKKTIIVNINGKKYNVSKCIKIEGFVKSDLALLNENGEEVVWISYKKGNSPKDFQQWGGMTEKNIIDHPEIEKFVAQMQKRFPKGIPNATTIAKKIKDNNLKKLSVYGIEYRKNAVNSRQNVSIVLQGPVRLVSYGSNQYKFSSNHTLQGGENVIGGYEPVLMIIYKGDRDNFGIKGARFAIQPILSRNINEMIKE